MAFSSPFSNPYLNALINKRLDETTCGSLCQHPSCWASIRRQEKGFPRTLPPMDIDSDSSSEDDEISLPKQSICNILGDYGDSTTDRYPSSTGGRPSHQWDSPIQTTSRSIKSFKLGSVRSLDTGLKLSLQAPHNTKVSLPRTRAVPQRPQRLSRLKLVEVQEVFDRDDLNNQWDETFITRPYYVWVPNPEAKKRKGSDGSGESTNPVLLKDLTSTMIPPEVEQKREDTILYDDLPRLKKRQQHTKSPPMRPINYLKAPPATTAMDNISVDSEGIHELLALPRETLLKVLERTKRSDFTTKGQLQRIVHDVVLNDEQTQMALSTREYLQQKPVQLHTEPTQSSLQYQSIRPVYQLDDAPTHYQPQTPPQSTGVPSDLDSLDDFPTRRRPLPGIKAEKRFIKQMYTPRPYNLERPKIPAISLGLPSLPSGVNTIKPFNYKEQGQDFSLGPIISAPPSERSSVSDRYSEDGATMKVIKDLSTAPMMHENMVFHSVSPALSTHVPMAPAGTPANYNMSPTKSTTQFSVEFREVSREREPTHMTIATSEKALPPSRENRDLSILSSPSGGMRGSTLSPLQAQRTMTAMTEDQGLDTIRETARESADESAGPSPFPGSDRQQPDNTPRSPNTVVNTPRFEEFSPIQSEAEQKRPQVKLEASSLRSIDTAVQVRPTSGLSVESCPSPEQWPLISELSSEQLERPSVSEPGLSGRSDQRRAGRGKEGGVGRDYARKVLDEKRKAESPAPPPPSPEPKDHKDHLDNSEQKSRKDLKSRDSLSMAPLMEVSEADELSPRYQSETKRRNSKKGGRQEKLRSIHVTVPVGKNEEKDKQEEIIDDEEDGEVVSQITVLHIAPKGKGEDNSSEKIQETFLCVDIPAEELSSVQAEHGSLRQDDFSSGVQNSGVSETVGSATPGDELQLNEVKADKEEKQGEEKQNEPVAFEGGATHRVRSEGDGEIQESSLSEVADGGLSARFQLKEIEEDHFPMPNGKPDGDSLDSGMSPELLCDSARFISHETVSPDEGEDEEQNKNILDIAVEEEEDENAAHNLTMSTETKEDKGQCEMEDCGSDRTNKDGNLSFEGDAPGGFFFSNPPPDREVTQNGDGSKENLKTEETKTEDTNIKDEESTQLSLELGQDQVAESSETDGTVPQGDSLPEEVVAGRENAVGDCTTQASEVVENESIEKNADEQFDEAFPETDAAATSEEDLTDREPESKAAPEGSENVLNENTETEDDKDMVDSAAEAGDVTQPHE